jgi:hypothetical protein
MAIYPKKLADPNRSHAHPLRYEYSSPLSGARIGDRLCETK